MGRRRESTLTLQRRRSVRVVYFSRLQRSPRVLAISRSRPSCPISIREVAVPHQKKNNARRRPSSHFVLGLRAGDRATSPFHGALRRPARRGRVATAACTSCLASAKNGCHLAYDGSSHCSTSKDRLCGRRRARRARLRLDSTRAEHAIAGLRPGAKHSGPRI